MTYAVYGFSFLIFPLLLRALLYSKNMVSFTPKKTTLFFSIDALEDAIVAAELLLLSSLCAHFSYGFFQLIVCLYLFFLWSDFFFFFKTGAHLNLNHCKIIRHIPAFLPSLAHMGLTRYLIGLLIIASLSWALLQMEAPFISYLYLLVFLALFSALHTLLIKKLNIGLSRYENPFFLWQKKLFIFSTKIKKTSSQPLPADLIDLSQQGIYLDPSCPLHKMTFSFSGEKTFSYQSKIKQKPNIILLFWETCPAMFTGLGEKSYTPYFDNLSKEGVLFTNFFSNGTQTHQAYFASLFGVHPLMLKDYENEVGCFEKHQKTKLIGIHTILKSQGYTAAIIDPTRGNFDSLGPFSLHQGFDTFIGHETLKQHFPATNFFSWGLHDEFTLDFAHSWIEKNQGNQPFFLMLSTVSNHHPWILPRHKKGPQGFYSTLSYSDQCIGHFIETLRKKNLDTNTLIIIVGDHGKTVDPSLSPFHFPCELADITNHVPCLFLSKDLLPEPAKVKQIASHSDLLCTLMDMQEIPFSHHSHGRSMLRKQKDSKALLASNLFNKHVGIIDDRYRFTYAKGAMKLEKIPENMPVHNKALLESYEQNTNHLTQCIQTIFDEQSFCKKSALESCELNVEHSISSKEFKDLVRQKKAYTCICLQDASKLLSEDFSTFFGKISPLKDLCLVNALIDDQTFEKICKKAPAITSIKLINCLLITQSGIKKGLENLPNLQCLTLEDSLENRSEDLGNFLVKTKALLQMRIKAQKLLRSFFPKIPIPSLESLSLSVETLSFEKQKRLFSSFPHLQRLTIYCEATDDLQFLCPPSSTLSQLTLRGSISIDSIKTVAEAYPNLKHLYLFIDAPIDADSFSALHRLPLHTLGIHLAQGGDDIVEIVSALSLEKLCIFKAVNITEKGIDHLLQTQCKILKIYGIHPRLLSLEDKLRHKLQGASISFAL